MRLSRPSQKPVVRYRRSRCVVRLYRIGAAQNTHNRITTNSRAFRAHDDSGLELPPGLCAPLSFSYGMATQRHLGCCAERRVY